LSFSDILPEQTRKSDTSRLYQTYVKRMLDITVVVAFMPIWLPAVVVLALIVARNGGMPFFGHERVGRRGRSFRCWKLRTMVPDAATALLNHLESDPEAAAEWAATHKLRNDPRVTRIGAFLRATSLDELPQLWNVLCGQMSLVGPRPVTEEELGKFGSQHAAMLMVRPGLTGLWQVSGRNDISYNERVRLELDYVRQCSLRLDISILLRTVAVVVRRTGH